MKALLHFIEQKSYNTSNLGMKFWWWALETKVHRFRSFDRNKKKLYFTRLNKNPFYRGNTRPSSTKTKIVIDRVDGILFSKDVNIHEICQLSTLLQRKKLLKNSFLF
jgi:hypothetical protein